MKTATSIVLVAAVPFLNVIIGLFLTCPVVTMSFRTYPVPFQPKGCPVTRADTDASFANSALLTVKSIVVSADAVPAVSTAAATTIRVPGSTYSYVVPLRT